MSQTEIKTHISCSITVFENRAVYEIRWKNIVEAGRLHMTMWRMPIACCVPNATNRDSQYVTLTAYPVQQWLHERASMLSYTSISCLV